MYGTAGPSNTPASHNSIVWGWSLRMIQHRYGASKPLNWQGLPDAMDKLARTSRNPGQAGKRIHHMKTVRLPNPQKTPVQLRENLGQ